MPEAGVVRDLETEPGRRRFRSEEARERYLGLYDLTAGRWPIPSESKTVETSYGPTFVRIGGPETAPPLILLPGAAVTSLMWIPNIAALSKHFRTYAVDNICDFGRSLCTRFPRTGGDLAGWLDEVVKGLDLRGPVNLVGMSYGGWLAGLYLLRFPERVGKAVLLAPAGIVLRFRLAFMVRLVLALLPWRFAVGSFLRWIFGSLAGKGEAAGAVLEEMTDNLFTAFRSFRLIRLIPPTVFSDDELKSIKGSLLYMIGEKDRIYSARKAVRRLGRVCPGIRSEIIPGADHAFTVAEADVVNGKILDFLRPS